MARGRVLFKRFKPAIILLGKFYAIFPRKIQEWILDHHRRQTGYLGLVIRYALLKNLAEQVGDNVLVQPDVYLRNTQNLKIGNNVSFQPMTYIDAYGGVVIGNDVSIAEGASIFTFNHGYESLDVPVKDQPPTAMPVAIADNVWIGAKATILGNVQLAEGTIVAAGAVVSKSTAPFSTVAGVPAKVIRMRKEISHL